MSYAQFGYPYHPASQILVSGQTGSSSVAPNPCCESGRAVVTDPVTGQAVFSCQQCDSHSLVYPRLGSSVPSSPYAPYSEQSYPPVGMESPTFYSSLGAPYVLKEGNSDVPGWQSMSQPAGYYPYDPSLAAYGYGYDLNGARRKNATREATTTLKTWLNDHKKNPYPTKGEKIMLAIITKMTLTQVSTWFANARRRLKKENKITWNSKGKDDDEDEEDGKLSDIDDDKDSSSDRLDGSSSNDGTTTKMPDLVYEKSTDSKDMLQGYDKDTGCSASSGAMMSRLGCDTSSSTSAASSPSLHMAHQMNHLQQQQQQQHMTRYPMDLHDPERLKSCNNPLDKESPSGGSSLHSGASLDASNPSLASQNKPKIWSLADTATCKTPPTTSLAPPRPNCATMTMTAGGATSLPSWSSAAGHPLPPFQVTSPVAGAYASQHPYHAVSAMAKTCDVTSAMAAARTSGQCSSNAFSAELQTDTPPQTPPNHKFPSVQVNYAHHAYGEHYPGGGQQRALLSSVNSRMHDFQGENL